MVKMINKTFGNEMMVSEDRVEEYKAAGHKLAASPSKPVKEEAKKAESKTGKKSGKSTKK